MARAKKHASVLPKPRPHGSRFSACSPRWRSLLLSLRFCSPLSVGLLLIPCGLCLAHRLRLSAPPLALKEVAFSRVSRSIQPAFSRACQRCPFASHLPPPFSFSRLSCPVSLLLYVFLLSCRSASTPCVSVYCCAFVSPAPSPLPLSSFFPACSSSLGRLCSRPPPYHPPKPPTSFALFSSAIFSLALSCIPPL